MTAAALICGIVSSLAQNGTAKAFIKLLCGLFLAFTAIRPIAGLDLSAFPAFSANYDQQAAEAVSAGEKLARESMADIIKTEAEAYILDKAAKLHAELIVNVEVSGDQAPVPIAVELRGEVSPFARQQLEHIIQADLGIAKEAQRWTG